MNNYEELGVAGEGTYGIVLKCLRKDTGEVVAIKQFREPDEDDESKRLAEREVKILGTLQHENIVQMREAFRHNGLLHVVFEYVEKCLVDTLDANPKGVGAPATRKLTLQLLRALDHCHCHNIIHRDVKPDNLLVDTANSALRLCDFGSACKTMGPAVLTDYVGTRWYRAPELLVSFNDYGPAVDIWAAGCVMAELMVGTPLFFGKSDIDQLCLINNALGPLTQDQLARCLELSNFRELRFPETDDRKTLRKRFGQTMAEEQLELLEHTVLVDPAQRLTARAALTLPWLRESQAPPVTPRNNPVVVQPRPPSTGGGPATSRPSSQRSRALARQKPRVRKGVSPCATQGGAVAHGAVPPGASITPLIMASPVVPTRLNVELLAPNVHEVPDGFEEAVDPCEDSIPEEILDEVEELDVLDELSFRCTGEMVTPTETSGFYQRLPDWVQGAAPSSRGRSVADRLARPGSQPKLRVRPGSGRSGCSSTLMPIGA